MLQLTASSPVWASRVVGTTDATIRLFNSNAVTPTPMPGQFLGGVGAYRTEAGQPAPIAADGTYSTVTYVTTYLYINGAYSLARKIVLALNETLSMSSASTYTTNYAVALAEVLNMAGTGGGNLVAHVALAEGLSLAQGVALKGVYGVQLPESLLLRDSIETNSSLLSYVVNINTNAVSSYNNFNFNSFIQMGSKFYGVNRDGIYELAGADDAGDDVNASITFGKNDLSSELQKIPSESIKRLPTVYLGINTDGDMQLNVTANGSTNSYVLAQATPTSLHTGRMMLGKGVTARYWDFELKNVAGADFVLESLTMYPESLKRRIVEN